MLDSRIEVKMLPQTLLAIVFIYYAPSLWRVLVNNWKVRDIDKYKALWWSYTMSSVKVYPNGWHQRHLSSLHWAPPLCISCPWNATGGLWQSKPCRLTDGPKLKDLVSRVFLQTTSDIPLDDCQVWFSFYWWNPTCSGRAPFPQWRFWRGNLSRHLTTMTDLW